MRRAHRGGAALPIETAWLALGALAILLLTVWQCAGGDDDRMVEEQLSAFPTATAEAQPFASCGVEESTEDSERNLEARRCLLDAVAAGTRVEFQTVRTTVEGAPIYYRIRVRGPSDVEVTVDNRADEFAGPARRRVTTTRCTSLEQPDPEQPWLVIAGCADGSSYEV